MDGENWQDQATLFLFKRNIYIPTSEKNAQHVRLGLLHPHSCWNSVGKIFRSRLLPFSARYRKYWYKSQLQRKDLLRKLEAVLCRWQPALTT